MMEYKSNTIKKITKEITKERYKELSSLNNIFLMRENVKHNEIPEDKRALWYGCALIRMNNKYYLIHTVDINYQED